MPTYDYRCAACGHDLEVFQSIHDPVLRKCPKCKKAKLERLIGPGAGILFKGGGFYQTDYRSENYKKGESAEKASSAPAAESTPAKEAAPAKNADEKTKPAKPDKGAEKKRG
jgi:putative FmdB family regulatory protein